MDGEAEFRPDTELRVSTLELFFDLVYVFAITQIASLLSGDLSPAGFGRAALVLALVWWAWSQYAWALNAVGNEGGAVRAALVVAMAGSLFLAQAVPEAFAEAGVWFAIGFVLVRYLGLATYWIGLSYDREHRRALHSFLPLASVAPLVVLVGGFLDDPVRTWVWVGALALEVGATLLAGRGRFQVEPAHFAERHGLIVIIVLGEAIIAVGLAAAGHDRDAALAAALAAGLAGAVVLWWSYFDWVAAAAERRLRVTPLEARGRMARDLYTFLHLPIVAGVILYAVAAKKAVAHPLEALPDAGLAALALGFGLFLVGFVLGNYRATGRVLLERVAAIVAVALLCVLARGLAAVAVLTLCTAAVAAALVVEAGRRRAAA